MHLDKLFNVFENNNVEEYLSLLQLLVFSAALREFSAPSAVK